MKVIHERNVHEALPEALERLEIEGIARDSRNGPVVVFPTPVTTVYEKPNERVMFWPERDCNPFFHLFESLWMLGGRNDVNYVAEFVKRMRSFSDDGKTFHGAYGYRWRFHFGFDQLSEIANVLHDNPDDRRCVLQMWDAQADLGQQGKDFPCNTSAFFSRGAEGELNMTVLNRSNDMVWGAYGANAVHFSVLLEYMAAAIGCPVGRYWQVSNNLHAYLNTLDQVKPLLGQDPTSPYTRGEVEPYPLVQTPITQWTQDLMIFLDEGPIIGLRDPFFRRVATPMWMAHKALKQKDDRARFDKALEILQQCHATDWRRAAEEWVQRRAQKAAEKEMEDV